MSGELPVVPACPAYTTHNAVAISRPMAALLNSKKLSKMMPTYPNRKIPDMANHSLSCTQSRCSSAAPTTAPATTNAVRNISCDRCGCVAEAMDREKYWLSEYMINIQVNG